MPGFSVYDLQFEHYQDHYTIGVHDVRPRMSWKFSGTPSDFCQSAYELMISELSPIDNTATLICRRKVESQDSVLVPWPHTQPLRSRQRISVRVKVWDSLGKDSGWSKCASLEIGLLHPTDWQGVFITRPESQDTQRPLPEDLFRKQFSLRSSDLASARLYITSRGVYEASLDGQKVGDHILAPGFTNYNNKIHYQTYDVRKGLDHGRNSSCIGVRVAEGWFCGRLAFGEGNRNIWGTEPSVLAQLEIIYADGTVEVICTDRSWLSTTGPTQLAEIYDGEKYDANLEVPDWSVVSTAETSSPSQWCSVRVAEPLADSARLVPNIGEPVRELAILKPVDTIVSPSGKLILDFGENLVGFVRLRQIRGEPSTITLSHAEVLEDGELGTRPLRNARAQDQYTMRGSGSEEMWQPRFTYHGFRFCQIDGWPADGPSMRDAVEAVVLHSDMAPIGRFSCSDNRLNQLHRNAARSMRGNFFYIPTDCPQRDERLGWTGDAALFTPTAMLLYNCTGVMAAWLDDVVYEQGLRGGIPSFVTPDVFKGLGFWEQVHPVAIWHDVTILAPWALYQATGDARILETHYASMVSWLDAIPRDQGHERHLWDPNVFQFGDWLDPSAPPSAPQNGQTDCVLVADAFLFNSTSVMVKIAGLLDKSADATRYANEASTIKRQFANEYLAPSGRIAGDSLTAYALAICFDCFENAEQLANAGKRLAHVVKSNDFKIGTGFAGTPFICDALVQTGHADVAYAMLLNEECPSWLYAVSMGATTVWERWDSMLPDGSINPGEMTSFNHYTFGAIARFLHTRLAGLQCLEAGWKRSRVEPLVGAHFTSAEAEQLTPYGPISASWDLQGDSLKVSVVVPPTTTVELVLPGRGGEVAKILQAGSWTFTERIERDWQWPVKGLGGVPWLE